MNKNIILALLSGVFVTSCINHYLPDTKDAFDPDATFIQTSFSPTLGRNTKYAGIFNSGSSTLPFTMEIVNLRRYDGSDAPELTEYFPVRIWKTPYLGTETSLVEIEAKRAIENRQLFQIMEHSGEIVMWSNANSSFVRTQPDPGYVFDVKVENSGGRRYFTNMNLTPVRENAYEPNNTDPLTGLTLQEYIHPVSTHSVYTTQTMNNSSYFHMLNEEDIQIYFHKNVDLEQDEPTLTFRFYNPDYTPIPPSKFNLMGDWTGVVHGFDAVVNNGNPDENGDSNYVRYKVAYPIPLVPMVSKYTNTSGEYAEINLRYDFLYRGYNRLDSETVFDFAIYEEGHWEIIFVFAGGAPYFGDSN